MSVTADISADTRAQRMARLKDIFGSLPEGRTLLQLAGKMECTIAFRDMPQADVPGTMLGRGGSVGFREAPFLDLETDKLAYKSKTDKGYRLLIDEECSDDEVVEILAHELRHLWQYSVVPPEKLLNLSIPQLIAATRVMEGDAYTFQKYVVERLKNPAIKGPEDFDWKKSFVDFQGSVTAEKYDHIEIERARLAFTLICHKVDLNIIDIDKARKCAAGVFNINSLGDLAHLPDMLVAGQSPDAPNYMKMSTCDLVSRTLDCVHPHDLKTARDSMRGVNPQAATAGEAAVTFRRTRAGMNLTH